MTEQKALPKGLRESFAQFLEQPTRPKLRQLLQDNFGEFDHIDFKRQWPNRSKLARDILGFANSTGGIMVVGVQESAGKSLSPDGVAALTDKTEINNAVKKFLPDDVEFIILDFPFTESEYPALKGKTFQVLLVEDRAEHLPFIAIKNGDGIQAGAIYVRNGVSTVTASHYQLQKILNRRIATGHSTNRELTLKEHLDELQTLYASIPQRTLNLGLSTDVFSNAMTVENPVYPKETYEAFVVRMIETKKQAIEDFLRNTRY